MLKNQCLITVLCVFCIFKFATLKSPETDTDFIEKQEKILSKKGVQCTLKKVNLRNLHHHRLTAKSPTVTIKCILESMKDKDPLKSMSLWNVLGSLYQELGQKSEGTFCFKQASKLGGKLSAFVNEWSFIGPFVIGKTEVDGDPVEAFGGIENVAKSRYKKNANLYSELVPEGKIQWMHLKQTSVDKMVQVRPAVNWNELVNSLGSMGITEWQGWVVGEFAVNEDDLNIIVQCHGAHTIYIDDVAVTGDVYHRDKYWHGVNLSRGLHTVYIKLRTKVNAQFLCKFKIAKISFEVLEANFLPDLVDGNLFSQFISFPVANYHSAKFLKISKVALSDLKSKSSEILNKLEIKMKDSSKTIAPGQIYNIVLKLNVKGDSSKVITKCSTPESSWDIEFNLKFATSAGSQSVPVQMRCRTGKQSFLFTFIDHDGALQHAAAIQPLQDCPGGKCPVMLSLHGTTIPPQNQADSYKHMVDGDFVFGFPHAWTLAPTRHGAHNWEGPGLLTAVTALDTLGEMTSAADWFTNKADSKHVVYAGHSMGGHGAWHISTHYPDKALAVVALAGWIKKEEYGDSNLFFRHDIATSHVDPALKSVLESCIVENDADQHVTNLHGVLIVVRIGAADRTVHPWFSRRMYRLLEEEGMNVSYTEVKEKEHWWWDTVETNDGGAVNDKYLRDFTNTHIESYVKQLEDDQGACTKETCGDDVGSESEKYRDQSLSFRFVCYNPALGEGMYGFKILQQVTPYRKSEIQVLAKVKKIEVVTRNVLRLSISKSPNRNLQWQNSILQVDSTKFKVVDTQQIVDGGQLELCKKSAKWVKCEEEDALGITNRGPLTLGPARRISENPITIVIGTQGSGASLLYLQQAAVYISNLFLLTSDGRVDIVKDTDIDSSQLELSNLIVLGNVSENLHTGSFLEYIPFNIAEDDISLAGCKFKSPRTGVLTLAPNGDRHLALVLLGVDRQGLKDVISPAAPTIPPMTRSPFSNLIPDFVVTGPEFGRKGPGGYLCAGFYGNHWEYRTDLSSCVC